VSVGRNATTGAGGAGLLSLALCSCAPLVVKVKPVGDSAFMVCPEGTKRTFRGDSDMGWGEVEETQACERADQKLEGPAIELVASAPNLPSTRLVGHYRDGQRVGTWTQFDPKTGAPLGLFTFDASGSGIEVIHDQLGHARLGQVVNGKREGAWAYQERDGTTVATWTYASGKLVGTAGRAPWDPPMGPDPSDACPVVPDADAFDEEGCPERSLPPK
jgi:hypothetical protein